MHDDVERICKLKDTLIRWAECELDKGMSEANGTELMYAVDMIKDLCEAEQSSHISKAMEDDSYGRRGYTPSPSYRRMDNRLERPRGNRSTELTEPDYERWPERSRRNEDTDSDTDTRYGEPFGRYRKARKHYTDTKSVSDKQEMDRYANEHVMNSISTIREIWGEADPQLRQRMKADMTKLINDMN